MFQQTTLAMMVLTVASTVGVASGKMRFAAFGGCLNRTRFELVGDPAFHCHMDSSHCLGDEEWLTSTEVKDQGLGPCSCDENYESNVYIAACYDMQATHQVTCAYDDTQCPTDWIVLSGRSGGRHNNEDSLLEGCGDDSDSASGVNDTESCGKRCTCNFHYSMNGATLESGSSTYGLCFNPTTSQKYCAVRPTACAADETFYGPHDNLERFDIDCGCDNTIVGACVASSGDFSHCSVATDGCSNGQTFMTARQLAESTMSADCRLCENTWDASSVKESPIDGLEVKKDDDSSQTSVAISYVVSLFAIGAFMTIV